MPLRYLPLLLFTLACGEVAQDPGGQGTQAARAILARAITAHGMQDLDRLALTFRFRDRDYGIETDGGRYRYTRSFRDSLGRSIRDELTNEGLSRMTDGQLVTLSTKDSLAFAESVNSVRYFFLLPYGLFDPAVRATALAPVTIRGEVYDRVRVTFTEAGGGTDYDDVYHYFFHQGTGELDYLAYSFSADEGGIRFREAINKRRVEGVLIQDYINYGTNGNDRDLSHIDRRFAAGELPELSRILSEDVRIDRVGDR